MFFLVKDEETGLVAEIPVNSDPNLLRERSA